MTIEPSLGGGETRVKRIGMEALLNSAEEKEHTLGSTSYI